jgi:hypothetical protein
MRLLVGLMLLGLLCSASRGDEGADRARRVKVALALSCGCGKCKAPDERKAAAVRPVAALDWFVAAPAKVEVAPPPRPKAVAPDAKKAAAPAPAKKKGCACGPACPKGGCEVCDCGTPAGKVIAPSGPVKQLWQMWDAQGRTWYEWRDPAPAVMPAAVPVDWQVLRPAFHSPFPACVGTA